MEQLKPTHNSLSSVCRPIQDIGVGLRSPHFSYILEHTPNISWFEILTDNYLNEGGPALSHLKQIRERYPVVIHGVGMSIGSSDPLNMTYLQQVKDFAKIIQPAWISDHLCWISIDNQYLHQLMPLPYTEETIEIVSARIQKIQEFLGQQILIENVSSYLDYKHSQIPEWEFLNTIAKKADCFILLDINNIYVSSYNQQFSAEEYLKNIDRKRVKQFHLAGFEKRENYLLDAHNNLISDEVWKLYEKALQCFGKIPTLIEWDDHIPEFSVLQKEAEKAKKYMYSL